MTRGVTYRSLGLFWASGCRVPGEGVRRPVSELTWYRPTKTTFKYVSVHKDLEGAWKGFLSSRKTDEIVLIV